MTRLDLLKILVGQARANGFEFRRWYTLALKLPWESQLTAISTLETQRRYYALLFSHDFAKAFWKPGAPITFRMPARTFQRAMPDGSVATVERGVFMRRSSRPNAWRYHLREMAACEEPLRYMRKYLNVEGELAHDVETCTSSKESPVADPPSTHADLATLALARKAAARRQREVEALAPLLPPPRSSNRKPRLPGSR